MAYQGFLVASVLLSFLAASCYGVTLTSLQPSLIVTASPTTGQVLEAGKDNIVVTWTLNTSYAPGTDSAFKTVKLKLCYAPVSQKDRGWRKTVDELKKDKTCTQAIAAKPYSPASNNSFTWTVTRDIPTAMYFVRVYAVDSDGHEAAYGQTTDPKKSTNLFQIEGITGRHASLDIASACFSAFAIVSLFGFFFMEKRKAKALQAK